MESPISDGVVGHKPYGENTPFGHAEEVRRAFDADLKKKKPV
jgi:hypothetical protein